MKVVVQEGRRNRSPRSGSQAGFSLVELIVAFTILLILTSMAVPLARFQVRREREKELRADLREMREAINKYKDVCDQAKFRQVIRRVTVIRLRSRFWSKASNYPTRSAAMDKLESSNSCGAFRKIL